MDGCVRGIEGCAAVSTNDVKVLAGIKKGLLSQWWMCVDWLLYDVQCKYLGNLFFQP